MWENLLSLGLILLPLAVGFVLPVPNHWLGITEQVLSKLVIVILLCIGLSLSQIPSIGSQLGIIITQVVLLASCCIGSGFVGLWLMDRWRPLATQAPAGNATPQTGIVGGIKQLAAVLLGFWQGRLLGVAWLPVEIGTLIKGLLMLLILLVGISLAHGGMTLKQVLFNRDGVLMSAVFCASVALGAVVYYIVAGLLPPSTASQVSMMQALALSSGYGWYSLSGIVMTDRYGAIWGTIALLNDLVREFFALTMIPLFIRRHPRAAIGLGGVTSMDFTLPVIQAAGGNQLIPLTMSFGFVVNLASPLLMVLLTGLDPR